MPMAVISTTKGLAVTSAPNGLPVVVATNGYGVGVTPVASGGLPVFDTSGTLFGPAVIPGNTGLPVISGTTQVGQTLYTTVGTWSGTMATYTFQWKRGGANISGATGSSYLLVAGDYATMTSVTVTATNAAGSASATSAAVGPVTAAAGALATPTLTSLTTATDSGASSTDNITNDTTPDLNIDWGADPPLTGDVIEVRSGGVLIVTHTVTAGEAGSGIVAVDFPLSVGSNSLTVTHKRGALFSNPSSALIVVVDTTAPTLSSATAVKTGQTTATLGVTTNETGGALYGVLTLNSTLPTAAQIKAGQNAAGAAAAYAFNQAVSATGNQPKSVTGLTGSTTYYAYYMHEDVAGNQSTVPTGVSFTTDAAAGSTLTWDPAKKNAAIVLSNGNLTATIAANTFFANMLATGSGKTTGKYYCELTITAMVGDNQAFGLANASFDLGLGSLGSPDSVGWRTAGTVNDSGGIAATIQNFLAGHTLAMAVDFGPPGKLWFRRTGSLNWNNNASADPAAGTGSFPVNVTNPGPFFPATTLEIGGDIFTVNFGATAYVVGTGAPAGFGNWS
jgi:hypothetical protein